MTTSPTDKALHEEAIKRSVSLVRQCITPHGFIASLTAADNYRRIWTRDGVIVGIAATMSLDQEMLQAFRQTLLTLSDHQGPHGEIPSNVDMKTGRVSYGGTTGRVDAALWFIIGCGEYVIATEDPEFINRVLPVLENVIFLLGAWEFNNRGLLYVPATGDWADEYIHNGYILYDQLLYLQALRSYHFIRDRYHDRVDTDLFNKIKRLEILIRENYWFSADDKVPEHVYHEVLFEKGRKAASRCTCHYWLPFFSPHGYGYRFDAFANVLASLLGIADSRRTGIVDRYIVDHVVPEELQLLPAFYPVIRPVDKDWEDLKITFSYSFKNRPYEYHNCGLWPMITGFYAADLALRGMTEDAQAYLHGIHQANSMCMDDNEWSFPEYVHGKNFQPGGNSFQCWSASAALVAHYALQGKEVFALNENRFALH